jgi:MFS family permease
MKRALPRSIWVLGFVSLLMDVSSEMIHSLLPVFMVGALGASALMVGMVEGVSEATALIVKVFSGALSDYLGKRKWLAVAGYGLGALSKPLFALATTSGAVLAARFTDRIGKGIRGAPRDALIADLTSAEVHGAAYGLRQSLDTAGAVLGPLLGIALMLSLANDFRAVFWFAVVPAFLAVGLLIAGVEEASPREQVPTVRTPIHWQTLWQLDAAFWRVVAFGAMLALARFSEAFLILRAHENGLADAYAPAVLILMNTVYALTAYPAGRLADRMSRRALLATGVLVLVAADVILAAGTALTGIALGIALWGLHMGLTQGLLSAMVADTAPAGLRGTAFGVLNFASGIAMLVASVLAGLLWDEAGSQATFLAGAVFCCAALLILARTSSR